MPRGLGLALLLTSLSASAATFKWVDADGRVNYGDRPPENVRAQALEAAVAPATPPAPTLDATLPYPLRSAAARSPVTLYSGRDCGACDSARTHLTLRGVPFAERQLLDSRDNEAFRALGFGNVALPMITVGRDRLPGFDVRRLDAALDAAGYPRSSLMPPSWRPSPATPLAPAEPTPSRSTGQLEREAPALDSSPRPPVATPATRIRF